MKPTADIAPIRLVTDERLDFTQSTPLRKSYIVASSYRCGSSFLAWQLWNTGVLGAPCEYFNPNFEMPAMMRRLRNPAPAEYVAQLLARRVSANGVFGMKAHFHHLDAFLKRYPVLLEGMAPLTYIYINRKDRIAQAVSMAKAYQTNAWTSAMAANESALRYDHNLIARCIDEIEAQNEAWLRWFESHNITPYEVKYEELTTDTVGVIRSIVKLLDVQNDTPEDISLPPLEKQGDSTNKEWIMRYESEIKGAEKSGDAAPGRASAKGRHFLDNFDQYLKNVPASASSATGFDNAIRLRRRYDAIIGRNRDVFKDARVLDLLSMDGVWCMGALDAGASFVTGIDSQPNRIANAKATLEHYAVNAESYQFIASEVPPVLGRLQPKSFDVVLCLNCFELFDPRLLFRQMSRIEPKYVILDTGITPGKGPIARFSLRLRDASAPRTSGRYATILSTPSHELIRFMCDYFGFRWRQVDWSSLGFTDWTGIHDYEHDSRGTYVLERGA